MYGGGIYHVARGRGREEEDDLFQEGRPRDIAVVDDGNGRVADKAGALRRLPTR